MEWSGWYSLDRISLASDGGLLGSPAKQYLTTLQSKWSKPVTDSLVDSVGHLYTITKQGVERFGIFQLSYL
jgi:hypothetical protein